MAVAEGYGTIPLSFRPQDSARSVANSQVMRMRVLAATLAVACFAAAAPPADAASGKPHRVPRLSGRVVDQSGHPVAGATVELSATLDPFVLIGLALTCALSFGTAGDPACSPNALTARTDRNGDFSFAVNPKWTVGQPGSTDELSVTGHRPGAGLKAAVSTEKVTIAGRDRSVGTLVLWQPTVGLTRSNGQYAVHVPAAPHGATLTKTARVLDPSRGLAWSLALDGHGDATVDERVFETGAPIISVSASSSHVRYTAWEQRVADVGLPTSRGLACSTYLTSGELASIKGCPYTNGHLGQPMDLSTALRVLPAGACEWSSDCDSPNTLVLDLGRVRLLDAVVWRDCSSSCVVETSLDGGIVWSPWPQQKQAGDRYAVVTGPKIPVRYVRVRGDNFIFWNLRQVSVWTEPLPVAGTL